MDLIVFKNGQAFCDSSMVAKKIGKKHAYISDNIISVMDKLKELRVGSTDAKVQPYTKEYRGQSFTAYLMNREFFSLLMMQFRGKKSFEWQVKFNNAFYEMEAKISQLIAQQSQPTWLDIRKDGKVIVKQKSAVIDEFIKYAINNGSSGAKFYHANFAKMENKAMFIFEQKYPNMREVLTIKQMMQVATGDDIIEKAIKEGMEQGLFYKDIFKEAKKRIIKYVDIIGQSPILGLESK